MTDEPNTRPTPSVVPDDGLVERRFFIDHGMIHDRVTGKHVSTGPIEFGEGQLDHSPVTETCELLNSLAASDRDVLVGRIAELEQQLEDARPKYAQSCFDHEYITPGCPDCGKMA